MDPENQNINPQQVVQPPFSTQPPEILPDAAQTEQPPQLMHDIPKPKNTFAIVVIILLILTSLASLGYWAYKTYFSNQPINQSIPSPVPAATVDPTANWKTYTNTAGGYSVKYPPTLSRLICPGEETQLFLTQNTDNQDPINMASCARDHRYSLEIVVSTKQIPLPVSNSNFNVTTENSLVNGIGAVKYTSITTVPMPVADWFVDELFPNNGKFYDAYIQSKDLQTTFDQILSTFKFLGAVVGTCKPTYPVETNTPELTANQIYSMKCMSQNTKSGCLSIDFYNNKTKDFSSPDGVPDCLWTASK